MARLLVLLMLFFTVCSTNVCYAAAQQCCDGVDQHTAELCCSHEEDCSEPAIPNTCLCEYHRSMMNAIWVSIPTKSFRAELVLYRLDTDSDQFHAARGDTQDWRTHLLQPGRALRISIHSLIC